MDRFSKYNPKAAFLFFILALILNLSVFHPIFLAISLLGAFFYKLKLCGKSAASYFFKFILPLVIAVAVFNFLFTHYGQTVLFILFEMNFTLEGLFYGFCTGLMLSGVIMWFSCYNEVITSERLLCVFGGVMPNTALVFSMVLGFIPKLKKNISQISDARYLIDKDLTPFKRSLKVFSVLITLTLEESIILSDSMNSRGFGRGRRVYSKYKFSFKDFILMIVMLLLSSYILYSKIKGDAVFIFEPVISMPTISLSAVLCFSAFMLLPVIVDTVEDVRWYILKQRA